MPKTKTVRRKNGVSFSEWWQDPTKANGYKSKPRRYFFTYKGQRSRDYATRAERDQAWKAARDGGSGWEYDPLKSNPSRKRPAKRKKAKRTKRPAGTKVLPIAKRKKAKRKNPAKRKAAKKRPAAKRRKRNASKIPAKVLAGHKRIWGGRIPPGALAELEKTYAREAAAKKAKRKNPAKRKAAKKRPAKKRRKRNGEQVAAAARMFKKFHGKPATGVRTVKQLRVTPSALADCGKLIELVVDTGHGGRRLSFGRNTVRTATTGDGGQLYFVGGDQALKLDEWSGLSLPKDQVKLGELASICYHTSKDFHNFEPSDYEHAFGETGKARPDICYDVHSKRLYLVGGGYQVKRAGIVG